MNIFAKNFLINFCLLFTLVILFTIPGFTADSKQTEDVLIQPGKFVVKFKPAGLSKQANQSAVSRISGQYAVQNIKQVFAEARNARIKEYLNLNNVYIMETSESANIWKIVNDLQRDPEVEYAEPVYINEFDAEPNDPLYSAQYHLPQVFAPDAWELGYGDSTILIGIIDSGVDWDHEDLIEIIWTNEDEVLDGTDTDGNGYVDDIRGWDFVTGVSGEGDSQASPDEDGEGPDNDPMDYDGHGTHVSGLAAGHTNNERGIASVSSGARIVPLRCGWHANNGLGYVSSSFAADAYIYAAENGIDITNQSSGNSGQLIIDAAYYAFLNGVLIVESAGNGDDITLSALGSQPWVMSVASLNSEDVKAYYSSYGPYVAISAPGGDFVTGNGNGLLSTVVFPSSFYGGEQYVQFQGTSMAAPLIASVAGLLKSHEPELSNFDLFARLTGTADNIDALNPQFSGSLGSGRVNAYRALTEEVNSSPDFVVIGSQIAEITGNDNGFLDPGEQVTLTLNLRNKWQDATNVMVEISAEEASPLTIESGPASVGDVGGILDTATWNAEASFTVSCAADVLPLSQPLTVTISGDGFMTETVFHMAISPKVLLVADFQNTAGEPLDFSPLFQDAFVAHGISHDLVYNSETTVDYNLLSQYPIVVWGCEWTFPSLDAADRAALTTYLDNGGALFLSGQDIAWDLGATDSESNEYFDSGGASATFLNSYLKSDYIADIAGFSEIIGIENDPISDELDISFYQLLRSEGSQYPDVIAPRETATSVYDYPNGRSGAIRYEGDYRLVYFGFVGFEGITDETKRSIIMRRVINYLDGIEIVHNRLRDTEQTAGDYVFKANVVAEDDSITGAHLFWSNDGATTYNQVAMADSGNNNYMTSILAQEAGSTVNYFIYVTTESGMYAFTDEYTFNIGPDSELPTVELTNPYITQTINLYGPAPYEFVVKIDDNLGIDSSSAQIYYTVNESGLDSSSLSYIEKDQFSGTFSFEERLSIGDQIDYYAQVKDLSSSRNIGKSETFSIQIDTFQVIDDFEDGDWRWDLGDGWDLTDANKRNGEFSITDSPAGDAEVDTKNSLTFAFPFDLSVFQFAELEFYLMSSINSGDSLLVEVSNDNGQTWDMVQEFIRSSFSFRKQTIDLSAYTGIGNESVHLRFTMSNNADQPSDGVWIDDISFRVSEKPLALEDNLASIPLTFDLKQNYPNPFNPSTTIQYSLPKTAQVDLTIYTITGEKVKTVVSDKIEAGHHTVQWNGDNDQGHSVATGIYIYRIKTKGFTKSMKMLFLK